MLKVINKAEGAEIYITGDIIDDEIGSYLEAWGEPGTGYQWPNDIKKQLDDIDDEAPLTVYINSDGGSVPAGVAIANMIARHKGPTTAVVDGWACSIATQIFFAADVRKIPSNAYLMIHKPATCCCGDAHDMEQAIRALDVIQEGLETTYNKVAAEGVTPETIHQMVEETTWLTGKETSERFQVELLEWVAHTRHSKRCRKVSKLWITPESQKLQNRNRLRIYHRIRILTKLELR